LWIRSLTILDLSENHIGESGSDEDLAASRNMRFSQVMVNGR
jgi:hypothetical protein